MNYNEFVFEPYFINPHNHHQSSGCLCDVSDKDGLKVLSKNHYLVDLDCKSIITSLHIDKLVLKLFYHQVPVDLVLAHLLAQHDQVIVQPSSLEELLVTVYTALDGFLV